MLAAAIELIRAEGVAGVTVSRVTRAIGVDRSLFYSHFKTVDECLAEAAVHVVTALTTVDSERRAELHLRYVNDREAMVLSVHRSLDRWMEQRPFVEMLVRLRLDPSSFGAAMRPMIAKLRHEFAAEVTMLAGKMGAPAQDEQRARLVADAVTSQWLWALECLCEDRSEDRRAVAEVVCNNITAGYMQLLRRETTRTRAEVIAARFDATQQAQLKQRLAKLRSALGQASDAAMFGAPGSAATVADAALAGACRHFLPEVARDRSARVEFVLDAGGEVIRRQLVVRDGTCTVARDCEDGSAQMRNTMTLRTFLECTSGLRTFGEALIAGDLRTDGDMSLGPEFTSWFYQPGTPGDGPLEP